MSNEAEVMSRRRALSLLGLAALSLAVPTVLTVSDATVSDAEAQQMAHCSSLKGIPKMKLQDSGPSGPKSLQSQNRPRPENRLSISRLDVVHGQLFRVARGLMSALPPKRPKAVFWCRWRRSGTPWKGWQGSFTSG
jgi:hypothetical protein